MRIREDKKKSIQKVGIKICLKMIKKLKEYDKTYQNVRKMNLQKIYFLLYKVKKMNKQIIGYGDFVIKKRKY